MLSYRHAFHAGNFADVLKHAVLANVLEYMTRKEKGFSYVDTHSGAGMYSLYDEKAEKTGEYKDGIGKLYQVNDLPELLEDYVNLIKRFNNGDELRIYPGSPSVAHSFFRRQDNCQLFELHSTDHQLLSEHTERWKKCQVHQTDGYKGLLKLLPPVTRRGVVLIDPPYEIKDDYTKAVKTVIDAYRKFATGTYIIWYPVVKRESIDQMISEFQSSDVRNLLQIEFCTRADTDEYGMTGTGLFIVNPPWTLNKEMEEVLPFLTERLGFKDSFYTLKQLINE